MDWAPNEKGYFRDDNSLIKGMPSALGITSPLKDLYDGRRIGKGFVASHVWRVVDPLHSDMEYASRDPWTYSFVPNLVRLPIQVSKLTDREGSFSQIYLQALSAKIYRHVPVSLEMRPFVEGAWSRLSIPEGIPKQGLPEEDELSFFNDTPSFRLGRLNDIGSVANALEKAALGQPLEKKVVSSRYAKGLNLLSTEALGALAHTLRTYTDAIRATSTGGHTKAL